MQNFGRKLVDEAATGVGEAGSSSESISSGDNPEGIPGVGNWQRTNAEAAKLTAVLQGRT